MQNLPIPVTETTELAAAFLQTAITFSLGIVCIYLYLRYRRSYFVLWALAWGVYSLRLVAIISFLLTHRWGWLYWHQVTTGWTALALLSSALVFSRQLQWRRRYWILVAFPPAWSYVAIYRLDNFLLAAGPAVVFLSLATFWTGLILWRHHRTVHSGPAALMAWSFFLWSLHHLDYPFLRARGAWNPWGYYLDIAFELAIGAGILLLVIEDQHQGLATLSALSGDLQSGSREDDLVEALLMRPLTLPGVEGSAMYLSSAGVFMKGVGSCESWTGSPPSGPAHVAVERVVRSGAPEVVRAVAGEGDDPGPHPAYVAALPVFLGDEIRGAFLVAGRARDPLTVLDARFLVALGHQVGAALANADLYQRLEERTADLERLAARMVVQHEEERRRLSRELHDESAQVFAALKLQLGLLGEAVPEEKRAVLDRSIELVGSGIRSIRSVARDLRPSLLDDLGLLPALRALVDEFRQRTGIEVEMRADAAEAGLSDEVELALFRSLQEGLANVARHADASHVRVVLESQEDEIVLRVTDNGRGLGAGRAREDALRAPGVGLAGMRERLASLGGELWLGNAPGGGAELVVRLAATGTPGSRAAANQGEPG